MRNKFSFFVVFLLLLVLLTGCATSGNERDDNTTNENLATVEQSKRSSSPKKSDIFSYRYFPDSRFFIVKHEHIDEGTINGIDLSILVEKTTKVQYLLIEKFYHGYGLSMEVLVDENGEPILYEGEFK